VEIRSAGKPFYQRGSFWFGRFTWGLGLLLAVGLGIGWYVLGGFPRDHDQYGEVPVPGIAALSLPAGDVRLNFENHATRSGDSTTIDDQPTGLKVEVTPPGGSQTLAVDDVPSWLFGSTSGDRGHEPFAKVDVPSAGDISRLRLGGGGARAAPAQAREGGQSAAVGRRGRRDLGGTVALDAGRLEAPGRDPLRRRGPGADPRVHAALPPLRARRVARTLLDDRAGD
jgi:hypothetical protein